MEKIPRNDINPIKMSVNPPQSVKDAGMCVINTDGIVYDYVGIGWVKNREATKEDYNNIPQLED